MDHNLSASYSEAVSPLTSRKQGKLRAESLGISRTCLFIHACLADNSLSIHTASAGRGLSEPSSVLAAPLHWKLPPINLANLRPDTMALPRPELMREPLPCLPPLSIEQRLNEQAYSFGKTRGHNVPALQLDIGRPHHANESVAFPRRVRVPQSRLITNPYEDRADEIGPAHGIPGINHLGDLLTPPGWVKGMNPISPQQVRQLYNESRKRAREALGADVVDMGSLGVQERETREEARNKDWDAKLKLDKLLMNERITVYERYEVDSSTVLPVKSTVQGSEISTTLNPPAGTSIPFQHDSLRPEMPAHFVPNQGSIRPEFYPAQGKGKSSTRKSKLTITSYSSNSYPLPSYRFRKSNSSRP